MNVAKGADYTDFFSRLQITFVRFSNKKKPYIKHYRSFLLFLKFKRLRKSDTTFAQVIRCHFLRLLYRPLRYEYSFTHFARNMCSHYVAIF